MTRLYERGDVTSGDTASSGDRDAEGRRRSPGRRLTDRQAAILEYVTEGLENKEIARILGISEQGVKEHVSRLLHRLDAPNRAGLAEAGTERRILGETDTEATWLRYLFVDAPIMIAVARGPALRFVHANQAYRRAVGDRDLIGRALREAFPDLSDMPGLQIIERVYASGEPFTEHEAPRTWDLGSGLETRYIDYTLQPTRDPNGVVDGIIFFGLDVTDEALARREVALLTEERLAIFEMLPVGVVVVDAAGRPVTLNEAARRWAADTPPDPTRPLGTYGVRYADTGLPVPSEDLPSARALRGENQGPRDFLHRRRGHDGDTRIRANARALRDADGKIRGAVVVYFEIR